MYHHGGFNWSAVMGYILEKYVSNGKSDPLFTAYHLRVGKKVIQASPKLFNLHHQRNRNVSKPPMLGLSYASKAGHGYYKKSTRSIRLSERIIPKSEVYVEQDNTSKSEFNGFFRELYL